MCFSDVFWVQFCCRFNLEQFTWYIVLTQILYQNYVRHEVQLFKLVLYWMLWSKSLTIPGKTILSGTTTVFSLDDLRGLCSLSENLASSPCSFCSELTTWLPTRLRKTKITEGNRWLSKFFRRFFRLASCFWPHI